MNTLQIIRDSKLKVQKRKEPFALVLVKILENSYQYAIISIKIFLGARHGELVRMQIRA